MNIYVPHNRNVAPSGLDNVFGMDMYLDEMENFVKSFLTIHKDGKFLCHNPFLLDFLPKDSLVYIDKEGNYHNWLEYFGEGIPSEQYIKATKPVKLGSEHFSAEELMCHGKEQGHCNCGVDTAGKVSPRLLELLEQLRYNTGGRPIEISCAYRCPSHNIEVGGVPNSQHVLGTAADVQYPSYMSRGEFKWYAEQLPFDGVGEYDWGLHLDVRSGGIGDRVTW